MTEPVFDTEILIETEVPNLEKETEENPKDDLLSSDEDVFEETNSSEEEKKRAESEEELENTENDEYSTTWSTILNHGFQETTGRKEADLILVGDFSSGKTTIIDYLQQLNDARVDSIKESTSIRHDKTQSRICLTNDSSHRSKLGLQFNYLRTIDDRDNELFVRIWVLDSEEDSQLLSIPFGENGANLFKVFLGIVVDLSKPWNVDNSIKKWKNAVSNEIEKCIDESVLSKLKENIESRFLESKRKRTNLQKLPNIDKENLLSGALTDNIGVPVAIIGNKSDCLQSYVKAEPNETKSFCGKIRKAAYELGGSVVFTSQKERSTADNLYNFLYHYFYSTGECLNPVFEPLSSLFIPFGSEMKENFEVDVDYQNEFATHSNSFFSDPNKHKANDAFFDCPDDQVFFEELYNRTETSKVLSATPEAKKDLSKVPSSTTKKSASNYFQSLLQFKNDELTQLGSSKSAIPATTTKKIVRKKSINLNAASDDTETENENIKNDTPKKKKIIKILKKTSSAAIQVDNE